MQSIFPAPTQGLAQAQPQASIRSFWATLAPAKTSACPAAPATAPPPAAPPALASAPASAPEPSAQQAIRQAAQALGITGLCHFTRECNLETIVRHGLLSRAELDVRGIPYVFNDEARLDGALDSVCLTIGFPNYKMFYPKRLKFPNDKWIVLLLDPSVLWTLPCAFYEDNAASNRMRGPSRAERAGSDAFSRMFAPRPAHDRSRIPAGFPTSPQAEVLVSAPIPVEKILRVCLPDILEVQRSRARFPGVPFAWRPEFFGPRADYSEWKSMSILL